MQQVGDFRDMWESVAPGWRRHADYIDARGAELTERLLELARITRGDRVLELACGPGGTGLAAAERVAPGEVVLSDVAARMAAIAGDRARSLGLGNVTTRVLDLERIDEPDESFDVVLCREGLMFAADPARAAHEIARVLRPGGRAAVTVWGPRARNPWLGVVLDSVGDELGTPLPPPGVPGPFSLDDGERLARLLREAGLERVRVGELSVPLLADSFDEWWSRTCALSGPLAQRLAALPPHVSEAVRARAREAARRYETAGAGLSFPGVTLTASGRRQRVPRHVRQPARGSRAGEVVDRGPAASA